MSESHRTRQRAAVRNIIGNLLSSLDPQSRSMEYVLIAFESMQQNARYPKTAECEAALRDFITGTQRLCTALRRFRDESEARDEAA